MADNNIQNGETYYYYCMIIDYDVVCSTMVYRVYTAKTGLGKIYIPPSPSPSVLLRV
jgi:hypothetical protein